MRLTESASHIALISAYVITVCLYINILASFLVGGLDRRWTGIDSPFHEHLLAVRIIASIGFFTGLEMILPLEDVALWIALAIFVALFVGFGMYDWRVVASNGRRYRPKF